MPHLVLAPLERTAPRSVPPAGLHLRHFPCVIGRGVGCDVRVRDPMVSRRHCRIAWGAGGPVVEDLGSFNGTAVNGEDVGGPKPLADGDLLQLGATIYAVRLQAGPPAGVPRRVLVVEDDADAAETLAVLLRGWGHDVQVVADGEHAVAAARERTPDAVLLDLHVRDGPEGLEVAHRLRDEANLHDARVVAMTCHPPEETAAGGAGELDDVLVRPVDVRTLRRALVAAD
jgi:CheY-like chemotaxis protein